MDEILKINNEKYITLTMNMEQYNYLLLVLTGLVNMEKKVPKKFKTRNTKTLLELFDKVQKINVALRKNCRGFLVTPSDSPIFGKNIFTR